MTMEEARLALLGSACSSPRLQMAHVHVTLMSPYVLAPQSPSFYKVIDIVSWHIATGVK